MCVRADDMSLLSDNDEQRQRQPVTELQLCRPAHLCSMHLCCATFWELLVIPRLLRYGR